MMKLKNKGINKKHLSVCILAMALAIGTTISVAAITTDIGAEAAKEIALTHAGVTEAEVTRPTSKLDMDKGVYEYDVEFWVDTVEYDYEIHATTGAILEYDRDVKKTETVREVPTTATVSATVDSDSYIGEASAKEIALAHAGVAEEDVTRLKMEFDMERGVAEYEVEWKIGKMEYEYTIHATTGAILKYDVELDD